MNQPTAYFAEVYGTMFGNIAREQIHKDVDAFARECKLMVEDLEFLEVAEHTLAGRWLQDHINQVDWRAIAQMHITA